MALDARPPGCGGAGASARGRRWRDARPRGFLAAYRETSRPPRLCPSDETRSRLLDFFLLREGPLRDRLRARQPAGLAAHPARRHPRPAPAERAREWHERTRSRDGATPTRACEAIVARAPRRPVRLARHARASGGPACPRLPARRDEVAVVDAATGERSPSSSASTRTGFFAGSCRTATSRSATGCAAARGHAWELEDPYRFPPVLGELDVHLLGRGQAPRSYEKLGAHPTTIDGVAGVAFAVWAPNARRVSVVGDFNGWDGRRHPMRQRHRVGVWEIFMPGLGRARLQVRDRRRRDGELLPLKADPLPSRRSGRPARPRSCTALVAATRWHDARLDGSARGARRR